MLEAALNVFEFVCVSLGRETTPKKPLLLFEFGRYVELPLLLLAIAALRALGGWEKIDVPLLVETTTLLRVSVVKFFADPLKNCARFT